MVTPILGDRRLTRLRPPYPRVSCPPAGSLGSLCGERRSGQVAREPQRDERERGRREDGLLQCLDLCIAVVVHHILGLVGAEPLAFLAIDSAWASEIIGTPSWLPSTIWSWTFGGIESSARTRSWKPESETGEEHGSDQCRAEGGAEALSRPGGRRPRCSATRRWTTQPRCRAGTRLGPHRRRKRQRDREQRRGERGGDRRHERDQPDEEHRQCRSERSFAGMCDPAMRAPTSAAIIIATETGRIATPVSKASLPRTSCR